MISVLALWIIVWSLFSLGLVGVFVPAVPGVGLVFAGTLVYGIVTDFESIGVMPLVIFGVLSVLAWLTDYLGALLGARLGGGKAYTMLGMVGGAVIGVIVAGPFGLVLGAMVGAIAGALYEGKSTQEAGRAAVFTFLGVIGARLLQLMLAVGIIIAFLVIVL